MKLTCPNGHDIVGTFEHLPAWAELLNTNVELNPATGEYTFEPEGTTHPLWDQQQTERDPITDQRLFLCTEHENADSPCFCECHPESDLELVDEGGSPLETEN